MSVGEMRHIFRVPGKVYTVETCTGLVDVDMDDGM